MGDTRFPRKNRSGKTVESPYLLGLSMETFPQKKLRGKKAAPRGFIAATALFILH
jgi:hypothetical protein